MVMAKQQGVVRKIETDSTFSIAPYMIYVNPYIWNSMNIDQKNTTAYFFWDYSNVRYPKSEFAGIIDYQTGNRIGIGSKSGFSN